MYTIGKLEVKGLWKVKLPNGETKVKRKKKYITITNLGFLYNSCLFREKTPEEFIKKFLPVKDYVYKVKEKFKYENQLLFG